MRAARVACVGWCLLVSQACGGQGLELTLQVDLDEALAASVDEAARTAGERLRQGGIGYGSCRRSDVRSFELEGVEPSRVADAKRALADLLGPGWELLELVNGRVPVRMSETSVRLARDQVLRATIAVLTRRAGALGSGGSWGLGSSRPTLTRREGSADRIEVRLPPSRTRVRPGGR